MIAHPDAMQFGLISALLCMIFAPIVLWAGEQFIEWLVNKVFYGG